jgi:hypothetical protein
MGSSSTTTERRTQSVNPYVQARFDPVWTQASSLISTPFTPYAGTLAAPLSGLERQAQDLAQAGLGRGAGAVAQGAQAAAGASAYAPLSVTAPQLGGVSAGPAALAEARGYAPVLGQAPGAGPATRVDSAAFDRSAVRDVGDGGLDLARIAALQDPYQDQVLQASLGDLDRARRMSLNDQAGDFTKAGAFGGSRQGVADSLTNGAFMKQAAELSANLRSQGWEQASRLAEAEAARRQTAQGQNQQADLTAAGQTAGFRQQGALADAEAQNSLGQFNANLGLQGLLANLQAQNAAAQFGAAAGNAASSQNAEALNARGQFDANLAQQLALANAQNSLAAQQANQSAGLQGQTLNLSAAGLLGELGGRQQQMGLLDLNTLAELGGTARGVDQAAAQAAYQEFLRQQQYPMAQAGMLQGLLGALPAAGTLANSRSTGTTSQPVSPMQAIGTGLQLAMMFSDARLKRNVEDLGRDTRGRRWVSFTYVDGQPGCGVVAQEVERHCPEAVFDHLTGFKMVDYGRL